MALFKSFIKDLMDGKPLNKEQVSDAMRSIITDDIEPLQVGAFLVALHTRGEDGKILEACARVLLDACVPFEQDLGPLLDTCGTGGDGISSFNVSSTTAIVAAAAGAKVAKHGNRSVSSSCGSADLLEAAGVPINLDADGVAHTIRHTGIGFLWAPAFHPALAKVAPIRQALGVRTTFNLLGPLVNPAKPQHRIIGVFDKLWLEPMADAAVSLGVKHVLVVHSEDGMDEISVSAPTDIFEIDTDQGVRRQFSIHPEQYAIEVADIKALRVDGVDQSLSVLHSVLSGNHSAAYDAVVLNAGAALYAADLAADISQGVVMARDAIQGKHALDTFNRWVGASQEYQKESHQC